MNTSTTRTRRFTPFSVPVFLIGGGFILLVAVSLGEAATGETSFSGVSLTQMLHPWLHDRPPDFKYVGLPVNDSIDSVVSGHHLFGEGLRQGDVPLWNPYSGGGAPYAGAPAMGDWSPLNLAYVIVPLFYATAVAKVLEMVTAAGLTFLFTRSLRLSRPAALTAGVLYAGSGYQMAWTNWPQSQVAALVPGVFWGIERILQKRTWSSCSVLAIVTGAMLVGGYPGVVLYTALAAAVYTVVRLATMRHPTRGWRRGSVARLAVGLLMALILAAPLLLAFRQHADTVDLTYRNETAGQSLDGLTALTMVAHDVLGTPQASSYFGPRNIIETEVFVGLVPVLFLLIGMSRVVRDPMERSARLGLIASGGVFAGVLYGLPVVGTVVGWLPLVSSNVVARGRAVLPLLVIVGAAFGFDAVLSWADERRPSVSLSLSRLAIWAAGAAVMAFLALGQYRDWTSSKGVPSLVGTSLRLPLALTVVAAAGVGLAAWARRRSRVRFLATLGVAVLMMGPAIAQTTWASHDWHPQTEREQFFPTTAAHRFLQDNLDGERMVVERTAMWPGTTAVYGLRSVTGHYLHPTSWAEMLSAVDPRAFATAIHTWSFLSGDPEVGRAPLLDRMGARYFVTYPDTEPDGTLTSEQDGDLELVKNTDQWIPLGTVTGPFRTVHIATWAPIGLPDTKMFLEARATRSDGETLTGSLRIPVLQAGDAWVAVPADRLGSDETVQVEVRLSAGGVGLGWGLLGNRDSPRFAVTRAPADDPLDLVFAAGVNIYERTQALPRVRWASDAVTIPDPAERLTALRMGIAPDTVVLHESSGRVGDGHLAAVEVIKDAADAISVQVDARGGGWLVIADSLQDGWRATLDGQDVELLHADHGLVAVWTPAGRHMVRVRYQPPGWPWLPLLTVATLSLAVAWSWREWRQWRLVGNPAPTPRR